MSELLKSLDVAIGRYYKSKGNNTYFDKDGNGKFYNFCQVNGFDNNSIKDEIDSTPNECMLVEFDDNMPGAVTQIDRYNVIKRCYNACINIQPQNNEEKKDYETDEDDDDFEQECLINPSNDRRMKISVSPDKHINIIDCIGSLVMIHSNFKNNQKHETLVGTATVIAVQNTQCFLLTCAHNVKNKIRHCKNCNLETLRLKCNLCREKTKIIKPTKFSEPGTIRFERRDHSGNIINCYTINRINVPYQYAHNVFSRACQGYDICVLRFECTNKNDLKLFEEKCKNIKLVTDISLGNHKDVIRIYGFPGYILRKRNEIMYGMSTSLTHGHKMTLEVDKDSKKQIINNTELDTTFGQSGSAVWGYNKANGIVQIYGVHSGGIPSKQINVATFLDKENMIFVRKWLPRHKIIHKKINYANIADGFYKIQCVGSKKLWDYPHNRSKSKRTLIQFKKKKKGNWNQKFKVEHLQHGWYTIRCGKDKAQLSVKDGSKYDHATLFFEKQNYNKGIKYQFKFTKYGNNQYYITARCSNKVLQVENKSTKSSANIIQMGEFKGNTHQLFEITSKK